MASMEQEQGNGWRFGWKNPNGGKRARVRMGTMSKKQAEKVKGYIQDLADALGSGTPAPVEAAEWLLRLPPETYAKLAEAGLVEDRKPRTLAAFCKDVVERTQAGKSQSTLNHYTYATQYAVEHFGAERDIATITTGDALDFMRWMQGEKKLATNTAAKRCSILSSFFADAKRHKLILENPFADKAVPKSVRPAQDGRRVFVHHEEALRIMDELGHVEMRALFAFARWAGTRQTEPLFMRWEHVSFAAGGKPGHVLIPCEKTKAKTGKDWRKCPMFPEVEAALLELREQAPEGEALLFPHYRAKGANATSSALKKAMTRAGMNYPDPWMNLRRTRATELAELGIPDFAVCEWMGHDVKVANANYRRASEKLFATAAALAAGAPEVGQNPGHNPLENAKNQALWISEALRLVEQKLQESPRIPQVDVKKPLEIKGLVCTRLESNQ